MDAIGYSLRHCYLAEAEEVKDSLLACGWPDVVVHAAKDLSAKYGGVDNYFQAILTATKH
jgi:hypothetical protein